ncbi:hypothetical protein U9M48_032421 [Paspalum notatum var. saurae]|uniref:Uncharacterized protein n=1 Tax=Paspalum notatum var. saurae TaxID=547442 RepID=A0AAQ3U4N7_PASNO
MVDRRPGAGRRAPAPGAQASGVGPSTDDRPSDGVSETHGRLRRTETEYLELKRREDDLKRRQDLLREAE